MIRLFVLTSTLLMLTLSHPESSGAELNLSLRYQTETSPGSGRFHQLTRAESWKPDETAIIVCDVWDYHHCLNAVRRLAEFGPRLNDVLTDARRRGVTVIHSPSDCMPAYTGHPARQRAIETPPASNQPTDIRAWCSRIPKEERAAYPIDQSDGGEDDDPAEHAQWAAKLKTLGRNPGLPWQRQSDLITIDGARDFISDRGDEVWNILEARGIRNVILTGVHTNMCVLGRPFGLRQLVKNGRNVALMRDVTDTMYNPQRWPFVSHFTGTDLVISHIEKFICPTMTSDQFLGGVPVRLKNDTRPHIAIVMAEDEYQTERTLPEFAARYLGRDFRVTLVFGSDQERYSIPGLEILSDADVLLVSVRRRVLPTVSMQLVKQFVAAGKPVVGIRTASHAFALSKGDIPEGLTDWPEFDAQVLGGHYTGHYPNTIPSTVQLIPTESGNPLTAGVSTQPFTQTGSLYKTSPLAAGAQAVATGSIEGFPPEPVAWTFTRADGGRSFYTSLGHVTDFENAAFVRLLFNALFQAAGRPIPESLPPAPGDYAKHWATMPVPSEWATGSGNVLAGYDGVAWYRCVIRIPTDWVSTSSQSARAVTLHIPGFEAEDQLQWWLNGEPLKAAPTGSAELLVDSRLINPGDDNLLVLRVRFGAAPYGLRRAPVLRGPDAGQISLEGRWQFRTGDNPDWSSMPLPAKFGGATDMYFDRVVSR